LWLFRAYNLLLRLLGGPYAALTYFEAFILCDPGDFVQQIVLHFGIWKPNTSALIEKLLCLGDVCADLGANVGFDTLLAAHAVGTRGSVVAVEASPSIFGRLSGNIRANAASNIRIVHNAVSDRPGTLDIYAGPPGNCVKATTVAARNFRFEAKVPALPLDQILTAEERERLRHIKIDIEGGEPPVMRRFLDTLEIYPATISLIVEVSPSEEWSDIFRRMRAAGFSTCFIESCYDREWYLRRRHRLTPVRPIEELPSVQADVPFTRGAVPEIG
jgi:FkbM family methyltransferase